jgi:ADP-dependent NAD(P)H-hydrate dehydratase / NAD(P)H-hydrate epimerase
VKILTAAEMREVDRLTTKNYRVPSLTLMENAGKSVAEFIQARFPDFKCCPVIVLCGKGNNGGDGFVAARYLRKMGVKPSVHLIGNPREMKGDAATNLRHWKKVGKLNVDAPPAKGPSPEFRAGEIIVDALLGTGVRGPVEGRMADVVRAVNQRSPSCTVVAVDIPSGLNADTGEVPGPVVVADYTVTFTAPKPGLLLGDGPSHVGELVVRNIGSPPVLVEETGKGTLCWAEPREFTKFSTPRKAAGHKGDYGHALIVAGSVGKSGAAVLAGTGALRAGAGLTTVATPEPVLPIVASHTPEIMTEPLAATLTGSVSERCLQGNLFGKLLEGKRALGMGPGLTTHEETQAFVRAVVRARSGVPIILDADGLNAFAGRAGELRDPKGLLAVTPHPGEMARLLGCSAKDVQARRVEVAIKAAADWNACVVLKGHQTVIAAPDGRAWVNSTGNPGMATGGTGDVLTGILAGLTAQYGAESWPELLAFGVYLHGVAGDIAYTESGSAPLMASDLIRCLPRAFQQFYAECARG